MTPDIIDAMVSPAPLSPLSSNLFDFVLYLTPLLLSSIILSHNLSNLPSTVFNFVFYLGSFGILLR